MRHHYKYTVFASLMAVFAVLMTSCADDSVQPATIVRLDKILADYDSLDHGAQLDVIDSLRPEIGAMFMVLGEPVVTSGTLSRWSESDVVRVFQPAVDSVYPDIDRLQQQLGSILAKAQADSLKLPTLRYATVTWGNPRPIARVDSVMLIALNHFLGEDYPGYAQWQQYRRAEKTPQQLPYTLAAAIVATEYPMSLGGTENLLNWMLYEGALTEAKMRLVPDAKLYEALGYTPVQLKYLNTHTKEIWDEMALKKLIYDTDPMTIDRYIAPAPNTPLRGGETPGQIGRYIGYKIVQAYLKSHPGANLRDLLSAGFYADPQSLIQSGFTGK